LNKIKPSISDLSGPIKFLRLKFNLSQDQLAEKAGVGKRFVRELEQGKLTCRTDKVNDVLRLFGYHLMPVKIREAKELIM